MLRNTARDVCRMRRIRRLIEKPKTIISVCILLIFLGGICFIGWNAFEEESIVEDKEQFEIIQSANVACELTVKEKLAALPNDSVSLKEKDVMVILHGKKLDEFWSSQNLLDLTHRVQKEFYVAQFTVEGDAILTYLTYDGEQYIVARDRSRDRYSDSDNYYEEKRYEYLKICFYVDEKGNEYCYILLTNTEHISRRQLEEYRETGNISEDIDIYRVADYMSREMDENAPKAVPTTVFDEEVNVIEGVTMSIYSYKPTYAILEILNTTDMNIIYGDYYDLQVLQDGKWFSLSYLIDNWGFTAIGYYAQTDIPSEWAVNWTGFHGVLAPGQYRIVKDVQNFRGSGDYTKYYLAAEFVIEDTIK